MPGAGVEAARPIAGDEVQRRRRRARDRGSARVSRDPCETAAGDAHDEAARARGREQERRCCEHCGPTSVGGDGRERQRPDRQAEAVAVPRDRDNSRAPAKSASVALAGRAGCRFGLGAVRPSRRGGDRRVPAWAPVVVELWVEAAGLRCRRARRAAWPASVAGCGFGVATLPAPAGVASAFGVACVVCAARGASGVGVDASVPVGRSRPGLGRRRLRRRLRDLRRCLAARPGRWIVGRRHWPRPGGGPVSAAARAAAHAATSVTPRRFVFRRDDVPVGIRPSLTLADSPYAGGRNRSTSTGAGAPSSRGGACGPLPYFFERITPCSPKTSAEASCHDQAPWPPTCRADEPWPVCVCVSGWWVLFRLRASPKAPTEFDCSTEPPFEVFASLRSSPLPCFFVLPVRASDPDRACTRSSLPAGSPSRRHRRAVRSRRPGRRPGDSRSRDRCRSAAGRSSARCRSGSARRRARPRCSTA